MRSQILAVTRVPSQQVTTGDVARALQMTKQGVRWLVKEEQLACTRTNSNIRLFWKSEVRRLADRRTELRLAGKLPRRQKLGPRGEPRQISFLWAVATRRRGGVGTR
jgi:hypothetical protein